MPMFGQQLGYLGASSPAEAALQRAVVALGMLTNDARLALKVDGIVGPGTAAAVNRALSVYATLAPAPARTGKLSVATIKSQATGLTNLISQEIARRQTARSKAPVAKAPAAAAPPASKAAAVTLQRAVATLGAQRNDSTLKIASDGAVGPKTVAAVNRALTRYVSGAPANMRTGSLNTAQVASNAALIATYIEREIAAFKAKPAATVAASAAPSKAAGLALQNAIRALGNATKDAVLKIAADGIIGPRTLTAVNRALTAYLGKPKTDMNGIKANIGTITALISAEAAKRGGAKAFAPVAATPGAKAAVPGGVANLTVARMQRALIDLGNLVGDTALRIAADGIVGPKTTAAVNRAISAYVPNAPAGLKQRLAAAQVSAMADVIAAQVEKAVSDRRAVAAREEAKGRGGGGNLPPVGPTADIYPDGDSRNVVTPPHVDTRSACERFDSLQQQTEAIPQELYTRLQRECQAEQAGKTPIPATVPSEPSYTTPPEYTAPPVAQQPPGGGIPGGGGGMPGNEGGGGVPGSEGGGGGIPGGGALTTKDDGGLPTPGADVPAPAEKKKFPWVWVGVGTGVAVLGGIAIIVFSKKKKTARRRSRGLVPAHA